MPRPSINPANRVLAYFTTAPLAAADLVFDLIKDTLRTRHAVGTPTTGRRRATGTATRRRRAQAPKTTRRPAAAPLPSTPVRTNGRSVDDQPATA